MSNIWFTSDTHFWHENIIQYCNRPFSSVEEMTQKLVENWNYHMGKNDIVYHLGDFAYGRHATKERVQEVASALNGRICLILGNHDKRVGWIRNRFEWVKHYHEIKIDNMLPSPGRSGVSFAYQKISLFHYGMRTWHHDMRGAWHLYGHSHNGLPMYGKSMDVGVDTSGGNGGPSYSPYSYEWVSILLGKRDIGKHPEFSNFNPELSALDRKHDEEITV